MFPHIVTKDAVAVREEVRATCAAMFSRCDHDFVDQAFAWLTDSFTGRYHGYQPLDARYHDFEHTLQGTLCMMRILRGRHDARQDPPLDQHTFHLGLLAILMHDTGYLKTSDDTAGTGAKYTVTHVARSADFAGNLLRGKGFSEADIRAVQNMIRCTGVEAKLEAIPFQETRERMVGFALATGDLLGQMAAEDYVEKLPVLFSEFAEAAAYTGNPASFIASFTSAADLMKRTPDFWTKYVLKKLDADFQGLHRYLCVPYPDGPNWYLDRIEINMAKLRGILAA